jgi:DNA-binding NtrC family response regulator
VNKLSGDSIEVVFQTQDARLRDLLLAALNRDYDVRLETCRERLIEIALKGEADVVVLDCDSNQCPIDQQLEMFEQLRGSAAPIIVMTDLGKSATTAFLQRGAFDCIRRPPSLIELKVLIHRAFDHASMRKELATIKRESETGLCCDQLVGTSGKAQVVYDLIRRVADLSAYVLIRGESGTGKELVARAIHNLGSRADRPFVAVSCGAIPETLIESELFGHEKGAFTGSNGARAGYLEQAGDGTIFLDEIGELSLHTQVRLLRVLQQREFTRLGGNRTIPLNARVLFATHRDLHRMVSEGTFRQDLFFRVNVIEINVPPLRERTEDIPALARHFLKKYSEEYGKLVKSIRPAAMEALVEYEWPGNIRELENVIQGAVVLADGDSIGRGDLPPHLQLLDEAPVSRQGERGDSFDELLRQFKISLASKAVVECNGNKTLAARKLHVSRAYLHRLIRMNADDTPEGSDAAMAS